MYIIVINDRARLFFPGTPVSSINKTDSHNIIQLLHLNEINTSFNIVVLCSIKPHIDQVQV
jgi:hypothetical protein